MGEEFFEGERWLRVGDLLVLGMVRSGARQRVYRCLRNLWCVKRGGELWCPDWQLEQVLQPEDFLRYPLLVSVFRQKQDSS